AADPKIKLAGRHLAVTSLFSGTAWTATVALAETAGINAQDDKTPFCKCWPWRFGCMLRLEQLLLPNLVLATVPMTVKDRGRFAVKILGQKRIPRNRRACAIVELKFFEEVVAPVFAVEYLHLRMLGTRRQFAQQFPKL